MGFHNGQPYPVPQSNPSFCYDWSFGSPQQGYVLCVWHEDLGERNGRIIYECDVGSHTRKLRQEFARTGLTGSQRGRLVKQIKRSEEFEVAVAQSFYAARPLRLILNLGDTRTEEELADVSSTVSERELDTELWFVHRLAEGDALLVRGEPPPSLITPPVGIEQSTSPGEDDRWREGQIRVRQGQGDFRAALLQAYERCCAISGCALEPLLEAAHIIPHAEGTDYRTSNGILLRADLHTLYDLHHISIDDRGRVHLSRAAMNTEYNKYQSKFVRLPSRTTLQPSPANLDSRHKRFLEKEAERL